MSTLLGEMVNIILNALMTLFLLMADIKNLFGGSAIIVLGNFYYSRPGLRKKVELMVFYKPSLSNSFMPLDSQDTLPKISKNNFNSWKNKTLNLISKRKSNKNFLSTSQISIFLPRLVLMIEFNNLVL